MTHCVRKRAGRSCIVCCLQFWRTQRDHRRGCRNRAGVMQHKSVSRPPRVCMRSSIRACLRSFRNYASTQGSRFFDHAKSHVSYTYLQVLFVAVQPFVRCGQTNNNIKIQQHQRFYSVLCLNTFLSCIRNDRNDRHPRVQCRLLIWKHS